MSRLFEIAPNMYRSKYSKSELKYLLEEEGLVVMGNDAFVFPSDQSISSERYALCLVRLPESMSRNDEMH